MDECLCRNATIRRSSVLQGNLINELLLYEAASVEDLNISHSFDELILTVHRLQNAE